MTYVTKPGPTGPTGPGGAVDEGRLLPKPKELKEGHVLICMNSELLWLPLKDFLKFIKRYTGDESGDGIAVTEDKP